MTGQEFRQLRQSAGLTQSELGALVGTSWRMIAKYEAEDVSLGRIEVNTAIKLARALDVPVERFAD